MDHATPRSPSTHLDVRAFARTAGHAGGKVPLTDFDRVAADCVGGGADAVVSWSAQGEMRGGSDGTASVPWLHLQLEATLPLVCQRCLEPVGTPVAVDQWFRFVPDEETAEQLDDDAAEDLLVESEAFDLRALVEDELVLAMPLIASHASCPAPPRMSAQDAGFDAAADDGPRPFAALGRLRKGTGKAED